MKVAFILYGFFRTFEHVKHTLIKHVLDPLDCDVFFSTPETIYTKKDDEVPALHHCFSRNEKLVDDEIINFFGQRLKSYEIRQYNSQWFKELINYYHLPNHIKETNQTAWKIMSSLYSFSSSVSLFNRYVGENNIHYDAVIITRPDIRYYENFYLDRIKFDHVNCPSFFAIDPSHPEIKHLPDNERMYNIHTRRRRGGAGVHGFNRWLNDNILVGNQQNMIKFSELFDMVPTYIKNGVLLNYETLVGAHMIKNNILFTDTDFVVYEIWRPNNPEYTIYDHHP